MMLSGHPATAWRSCAGRRPVRAVGGPSWRPVPPRAPAHLVRFRPSTVIDLPGTVHLPIEGLELFGLPRNDLIKDSELNAVYEQLVGASMESGYSEAALNYRLEVLDYVRRELISSKGRSRDSRELSLPSELLPGALALMTEVGQCQLALDMGAELLATPDALPPAERRDVHLSMALANCGLASEILEGKAQVAKGCSYLEAALQCLESAGEPPLAPVLATQIRQGLASLRFQGALEQLSGAVVPATAEARKRAIRVVREALKGPAQAAAQQQAEVLSRGLGLAVDSMRAAVSAVPSLAAAVPAAAAPAGGGAAAAVASASAVVTHESMESLMDVLTCEEVVNLLEWDNVARHTSSYKWLYPGLLEAVAVAHVVHGFNLRQPAYIQMALGLVQHLPPSADLHVVEGVCHLLLGAVNQAAAALKQAERAAGKGAAGADAASIPAQLANGDLPASRDAYRFVVASSQGSDDGLLPGLCVLTERWLTQAAFPFFRDTAAPETAPASLVKYFDDTRVETLLTVYDAKSGGQLAERLGEAFGTIQRFLREAAAAGLLAAGTNEPGGASPDLEQRQRLFRAVAGGVALLAAVAVGLMTPPGQRLLGRGDGEAMALMRQRSVLKPITVAPEEFDTLVARRLLEQWQTAKACALGVYHTTDQLNVLLAEPLLSETLDKVATLRSHGAHMRFKLSRLEVANVKRISHKAGPAVRITAVLVDTADLHNDADGKAISTARRTYDAEYVVVQGRDGCWRITSTTLNERVSHK